MFNKISTLLVSFVCLLLSNTFIFTHAQNSCTNNRYKAKGFNSSILYNLTFAKNVQDFNGNLGLGCEGTSSIDLRMHVRFPDNPSDALTKRPVMLWGHGGGFVSGTLENQDMMAMIDTFANRGYVAATYQYRIGADVLYEPSGYRAVYRAMQDASAAIRYLKENADVLGIDTNYIFIGGSSAGAVGAVHLAYLTDAERPSQAESYDGNGCSPYGDDLGVINEHPIEKIQTLSPYSSQTFGITNHHPKPDAVFSCWGAVGDVEFIDASDYVPIYMFHGENDAVVPYDEGVPFSVLLTMPTLYGSYQMSQRFNDLGMPYELHTFVGELPPSHEVWNVLNGTWLPGGPNDNWDFIQQEITDFAYNLMMPSTPIVQGNNAVLLGGTETYSIANPQADETHCWNVVGGNIVADNGTSIDVQWGNNPTGTVSARAISCNETESEVANFTVNITSINNATCNNFRYLQGNFLSDYQDDLDYSMDAPSVLTATLGTETYVSTDLVMDLVFPDNDTATKRAAIIFAHSGGFVVPPAGGTRNNDDIQAWIDTFATRGYVTASMQYRLNLDVGDEESAERAVYRGAQDASAAIRFLKHNATILQIDTNHIYFVGSSAGAFAGIHASYVEEAERAALFPSTYEQFNLLGFSIADDLGLLHSRPIEEITNLNPYTTTTVAGNTVGGTPSALVSLAGAIGDLSMINPTPHAPPILMIHGTSDIIVSPNCAEPFASILDMPDVCGTQAMRPEFFAQGMPSEMTLYPGEGHEFWTDFNGSFGLDNEPDNPVYWQEVIDHISDFCYSFMKPTTPIISGPLQVCEGATETYSVTPQSGSTFCWEVVGGTYTPSNTAASNIQVTWTTNGAGAIGVREVTCYDAESDLTAVGVSITGVPSVLSASNITSNAATLSWSGTSHSLFTIQYRPTSGGAWTTLTTYNNSIAINGLQPNTDYEFQVQAQCSASTTTNFASSVFTTLPTVLELHVMLEGAYNSGSNIMNTTLRSSNLLPIAQPYNTAPWNYNGGESVSNPSSIPSNVVDWVLVEIVTDGSFNLIEQHAAYLLSDGRIVDIDGMTSGVKLYNLSSNTDYRIIVRHRNHLDVLSNRTRSLPNFLPYDFRISNSQAYGPNQQVDMAGSGVYGMYAGDATANGIFSNADYNTYLLTSSNVNLYLPGDFNLDGNVTIADFNKYLPNVSFIGVNEVRY